MKTEDIVAKIDAAKNHFGVVTHDSVRNELNGLQQAIGDRHLKSSQKTQLRATMDFTSTTA